MPVMFHSVRVGVDDMKKELLDKGVEGVSILLFESLNFELDAIDSELSERTRIFNEVIAKEIYQI